MTPSPVLRAAFIIISASIIFYASSEAYLIKHRPPYDNMYMEAVREILKREHIGSRAGDYGEDLTSGSSGTVSTDGKDNQTEGYVRDRKKEYSFASLKLDKVKDIHLKVAVFELDNELTPVNVNK